MEWYRAVAAGIESVLASDGSCFLNIEAHADEGQRNLYAFHSRWPTGASGRGGSWMSSAGAKPTRPPRRLGQSRL